MHDSEHRKPVIKFNAKSQKDYSEDEYITIFDKVFDTEEEAWEALKHIGGCVKTVRPVRMVFKNNS
jgi:hypothetical protein